MSCDYSKKEIDDQNVNLINEDVKIAMQKVLSLDDTDFTLLLAQYLNDELCQNHNNSDIILTSVIWRNHKIRGYFVNRVTAIDKFRIDRVDNWGFAPKPPEFIRSGLTGSIKPTLEF